ncbi:MAG: hypothetical protein WC256_00040 [Desulfurivibrionaceae bacterium]|jgi:hypothetical protein
MVVENALAAKAAAKSAEAALSFAADLVNDKPGKLLKLLYAFGPQGAVHWVVNGRLRLAQLKMQEELFNQCCKAVLDNYAKLSNEYANSTQGAPNLALSTLLEQAEGEVRLLATVKRSLAYLPEDAASGSEHGRAKERDLSWWSTFEDFAKRPNEDWRIDLLAKSLAANETEPGAVRLKALWEIGMLEADDFGMLAFFCDCAVHIDGKPLVILDPEEQNEFAVKQDDGRTGNLAHIVADLVDRRLLQKSLTQFETTEPVRLDHLSGPHYLHHKPPGIEAGQQSMIQIAAYGPTDYALDLCRLYRAKFNVASDANFESFQRSLEAGARDDEAVGVVEFRS